MYIYKYNSYVYVYYASFPTTFFKACLLFYTRNIKCFSRFFNLGSCETFEKLQNTCLQLVFFLRSSQVSQLLKLVGCVVCSCKVPSLPL